MRTRDATTEPAVSAAHESRSCPACLGALGHWREARSAEPGWATPVALLRCAGCGTAVTDTPPATDMHDSGAYASPAPRLAELATPLLRAFDRRRLRLLSRALAAPAGARPSLLDVGAGRGRFVSSARARGWAAEGIEPSARGIAAARERYRIELSQTTVEAAERPAKPLDAISLWHVLEHLEDPGQALCTIASWLRPGGVLLIGVPNLASLQAALGGAAWFHLDVPRHRTHFTPRGLTILLRRCGFEVQAVHHLLAEHNPYGMWQSLVNRVTPTPSYLYNLLKRNAPLRGRDAALTALSLPALPLAGALELAAGLARRGGTVAVTATLPAGAAR